MKIMHESERIYTAVVYFVKHLWTYLPLGSMVRTDIQNSGIFC